jgi:MFS family permease
MSTPAALGHARETLPPRPAPPPGPEAAKRPRGRPAPSLTLVVLFAAAAAYHVLNGVFHVTPAVFTDELLHAELSRSLAGGDGLTVRDEPTFFPSFLPALVQAPAWLFADAGTAYAVAKALNAVVMSAAVFPAYWLARALVRPSFALLAAAGAVAAPAMLYHAYLLSEALAYPVFLLALAVAVRELAQPSHAWGVALVGAFGLAAATRIQFLALPLVWALVVALGGRRELRRHLLPLGGLGLAGAAGLAAGPSVLGIYAGVTELFADPGGIARWAALTAIVLPFAAGVVVLPGAVLGLASLLARPRTRAEHAFARLSLGLGLAFVGLAGLVAAGDSERPLERYAIYLAPLALVLFFAYAERGAPWRRAYAGLALALGLAAWLVPFPSLADFRFSFDSPVLSAYGTLAHAIGTANAATVFAAVPLAVLAAVAFLPLTRRAAHAIGSATVVLLLATGAVAYAGDRAMTERALTAWAAPEADWLDRSGHGRADVLLLPGSPAYFLWTLESWNRDAGRPLWLDGEPPDHDPYPAGRAEVAEDGTLLVDGVPAKAGLLVLADYGSRIALEGDVLAEPRDGLTLVRVPEAPRVGALARGLFPDGWAKGDLRYRVWPEAPGGSYRAVVSLPAGLTARDVVVSVGEGPERVVRLEPGRSVAVELSARHASDGLRIRSASAELLDGDTASPRLASFRVERLQYRPAAPAAAPALRF